METNENLTGAIQICPYCEHRNVFPEWDVDTQGYIVECQRCHEKIMLCDTCLRGNDNPKKICDFSGEIHLYRDYRKLECFRGIRRIKNGVTF